MQCLCCQNQAKFSVLIAEGPNKHKYVEPPRYYIPNQHTRVQGSLEIWFCGACMRTVEDNFRATIQYLASENGKLEIVRRE